ncbi:MAG: DUF4956 domain-containing protein [Thermomicrobiales bacterium]|nr:DUF4956 domain-containing protein [Thermomicrobiales bacterium]MCO5219292.1 DUF4956 domain-containing protein [Thermomicrobiales bacterium]MCO5226302.1 DUF4956 domain-containing protein [Thermomicrobiales bacterium]MCO5226869.1 DUF4956 domain-containing protein [Thermomicrobiales bacterium]
MDHLISMSLDIIAITILVFGLYFPRHRNRDMIVAYLGINVGVLIVASVLSSVDVSLGVGIGLFGVLSIIRLRSDELNQRQVAYYFASLALGLLGGTAIANTSLTAGLMAMLLVVLWIGDSPRLLGAHRSQTMNIDRGFLNEADLIAYISPLLNGTVERATIIKTDLVNDTTVAHIALKEGKGPTSPISVTPSSAVHHLDTHRSQA